jgi:hypothetical protein
MTSPKVKPPGANVDTQISPQLNKVQRVSALVARILKLVFGLVVLELLAGLYFLIAEPLLPAPLKWTVGMPGLRFSGEAIDGKLQVLAILNLVVGIAIQMKILVHLLRLFQLYAEGKIFTAGNVMQIRQVGVTMLLGTAMAIVFFVAAAAIVVADRVPAQTFEPTFPLVPFVVGVILVLVSWIMDVGRELREEHELVV